MNYQELLQYIVCPVCKGSLAIVEDSERQGFACDACHVVYPIENEIPMLLPESGISQAEWRGGK